MPNLVNTELASKAYHERVLLDQVSLGVSAGQRIGVVGRNGAGKTTLLSALAGSADLLRQADDLLGEAASRHGAWMPGHESYLAVAQAWLNQREPDRCRAALAPLLTVARHGPWIPVLAQSLTVDGRALAALGRSEEARPALAEASRLATAHGMPRVRSAATAALAGL